MREPLPNWRYCETFEIEFGGLSKPHTVTVGYYPDGRIGEVFINSNSTGTLTEAIARDGAIVLSLALQSGIELTTVQHALTRDSQGSPMSIVGAVVDVLLGGDNREAK